VYIGKGVGKGEVAKEKTPLSYKSRRLATRKSMRPDSGRGNSFTCPPENGGREKLRRLRGLDALYKKNEIEGREGTSTK